MLDEIKRLAARNSIVFPTHALKCMRERGADRHDVKNALLTATSATWQDDHQSWKVSTSMAMIFALRSTSRRTSS